MALSPRTISIEKLRKLLDEAELAGGAHVHSNVANLTVFDQKQEKYIGYIDVACENFEPFE